MVLVAMNHRPCHFCQEFQFFSFEPVLFPYFYYFFTFYVSSAAGCGFPNPLLAFSTPSSPLPLPFPCSEQNPRGASVGGGYRVHLGSAPGTEPKSTHIPFLALLPGFFLTLFGAFFWFLFLARALGKEEALTSKAKGGERGLDKKGSSVQTTKSQSCSHSHR